MGLKDRLDRLEASLSPHQADNGARERFKAKLAAITEGHRARRQRGEEPVLEGQGMASLLGLVESYPYGAVPQEVAEAAKNKAQELSHGPYSVAAKMVHLCLQSKGYGRGD
jgi:hypothetical protein